MPHVRYSAITPPVLVDGLSQSTGVVRMVELGSADEGVLLVLRNRVGDMERDRVVDPAS